MCPSPRPSHTIVALRVALFALTVFVRMLCTIYIVYTPVGNMKKHELFNDGHVGSCLNSKFPEDSMDACYLPNQGHSSSPNVLWMFREVNSLESSLRSSYHTNWDSVRTFSPVKMSLAKESNEFLKSRLIVLNLFSSPGIAYNSLWSKHPVDSSLRQQKSTFSTCIQGAVALYLEIGNLCLNDCMVEWSCLVHQSSLKQRCSWYASAGASQ